MNKKTKAFTVIELVIVTLLSALTVTIAYKGNEIFQQMFFSFRAKEKETSGIIFLNRMITTDINQATCIYKTDEGFSCYQKGKEIYYIITDDYIVRNYLITDTFFIATRNIDCTFEKRQTGPEQLADRISFIGSMHEDTLYFDYSKRYAADVLMKFDHDIP
jgi:hypothetical protein